MKIALLGYGKMGKEIELIALQRKHDIVFRADEKNADFKPEDLNKADVAIEFSTPSGAVNNILKCFDANLPESQAGIPVVIGTTGWYDRFDEIKETCLLRNQTIFYATNFSIGVNIFFEINKELARLMSSHNEYEVRMEEIHHLQKADAPSGTAITLANDILAVLKRKQKWVSVVKDQNNNNTEKAGPDEIEILSIRKDSVPGTHIINYDSEIDNIEIRHTAKSRKGFAIGAVLAAEWILGKKGIFGMKDMLCLKS